MHNKTNVKALCFVRVDVLGKNVNTFSSRIKSKVVELDNAIQVNISI